MNEATKKKVVARIRRVAAQLDGVADNRGGPALRSTSGFSSRPPGSRAGRRARSSCARLSRPVSGAWTAATPAERKQRID